MNKVTVKHQGAPLINVDNVHVITNDMIALSVDMKSKYCEVMAYANIDGCPAVIVGTNEHSLHLNEDVEGDTDIVFYGYEGWYVFIADISRYTLRVCLAKEGN